MFCGECGTKNIEGAKFCENCGTKLVKNVPKQKESIFSKLAKLSNKTKILIGVVAVLLLVVSGFFLYGKRRYTPEREALNYFKAVVNKDVDALYDFLEIKSSKFTTKEIFQEQMKEELEEELEILNYKVTDTVISPDGLNATVTIRYTVKGQMNGYDQKITLAKEKTKKMLFFDNWKVQIKTMNVIEDYELKVLKNSKVTVAGIELTKEELNKKESTDQFDVYTLPAVFHTKYSVVATLPLGFEIKTTIYPSSYSKSETIQVTEKNLSKEAKKAIVNAIDTNLNILYKSAIANKKFDEIKSNFDYEGGNSKKLEKSYDAFNESLNNRSRKLKEIKFNETEIRSLEITKEGYLEVYFKTNYDYKTSYKFGTTEKTSTNDSYMYTSMSFDYQDGYQLVLVDNLNYYFY